jgi:hypothetical protein
VNAWFFKYLATRDLNAYPNATYFQKCRPITDYYHECQRVSIPLYRVFLSAYINGETPAVVPSDAYFTMFTEWARAQNFPHVTNSIVVGREMGRIEREQGGITIRHTNRGSVYTIDKAAVKVFLTDKHHYDETIVYVASNS